MKICNAFEERHLQTRRSNTANITKDDITLQHIAKMSLCCKVISAFVIFAVDLLLLICEFADVFLKRRCKLPNFLQ